MLEHLPLIVFLVTFVLIFVLRMPIPAGMIAACTLYFLTDGLIKGVGFGALITGAGGSLHLVAQKTIEAIFTNGTIVAVPLFIFAANVMNAGKITEYVFGTCMGLVGRFRGGLAHVNVLASLVFSGMTGSAIADASGLGKLEIDAMRKEGYDDGFSCAITAASATIGPIFPPSIPMVVYAMLTGASVGALFMAGMVPGVLPDAECFEEESHWDGLLEYPQYSRPAVWHDRAVPEILLSGDHAKVAAWRKKESYKRTMTRRPDLFANFDESKLTTKAERKILAQAKEEFAAEQAETSTEPEE